MNEIIAIDTGFSSVKVKTKEKEFKFPSAIATHKPSAISLGEEPSYVEYQGKKYIVGEEALDYDDKKYARSIEFLLEYAPLFVAEAIKRINKKIDTLSVGLPLGYYMKHKEDLEKKLSKFMINDEVYEFNVLVHPQGVGILADYVYHEKPEENEEGYVLDIGFNTVIAVRYKELKAKAEGSKQYELFGISKAIENLQEYIKAKYDLNLNSIESNDVFLKGYLKAGYGKKYDLTDQINQIMENYIDTLLKTIEDEFDRHLKKADKLIIAGGGAYHIKKYLPEKYKDFIHIPSNPEFANVRGFYILGNGEV
ncbi:ParM/StbA family protein [Persephonella sp. KM09-Lau-8]|uniref:ParM/StbA family protein n=1 Tax=Persephonella sp. KM09-Lau-8 TaxID=1158345 RepID=UPI0004983FA5|nr:ParM/StbA family protein [Persephonella sp. KM09-Lau-8]